MSAPQRPTIVMTPPVNTSATAGHPRRPPAHRSVSLLHSPKKRISPPQRSDSSSDSGRLNLPRISRETAQDSPSSLQPFGMDSSGESSNAEKWFENSNNAVRDTSTLVDTEPPFFMRNSSSSQTPPERQQQTNYSLDANGRANSLSLRADLLQLGTDGSSTEDFRGVIDDLTIQNKKLKRRLKKYEKLHDSHLKDEKLFEVRIHGLPQEKKRELEETLRKFAASLNTQGGAGFPTNGYEGLLPLLSTKAASSQTSLQQTDSAYASMSASGQGGSSGQSGSDTRQKKKPSSALARHQNIRSYLHDIPEGLMPQSNPATMTERARKKLVVKRLEQIFAGKGAAGIGHSQPLQQQEVSQMAARADRTALEAQGQRARKEGHREAVIMDDEEEDANNNPSPPEVSGDVSALAKVSEQDFALTQSSLEQRPTRPLDLDPHRAQVPADNMRYMRHLGFSPPDLERTESPEDGHGWIYLNLLVNMAQLHTINVTADFVRLALSDYSAKFEVSPDGRKVRWRGGRSVTRTSSSSGAASGDRTSDDAADSQSPRKRPKLTHHASSRSNVHGAHQTFGSTTQRSRSQAENSKFSYTPMFFHKDSTEESDDSSSSEADDGMSSPFPAAVAGDSSGMTSSGVRTITTRKNKAKEGGPIIFYNNARFCTDLSGERKPESNSNAPPYVKAATQAIGKPGIGREPFAEKRGPLADASELPEPMDLGDNPIPASMELDFPVVSPPTPDDEVEADPVDFEVTGIGGVYPADNFAIDVQSRYAQLEQVSAPEVPVHLANKYLPPRFAQILDGAPGKVQAHAAVHEQVLSSRLRQLPPSELPPALCFMPSSDDFFDDDESDMDDQMSEAPELPGGLPPSAAPQVLEMSFASSEDEGIEGEDDGDSDSESDSSLDLLAAAREVDPEAIRAREREYDANMAERLAEEIPAGSSAATAGGGSGFASPERGVTRAEYERAKQQALQARAAQNGHSGLKRAKTSDSMQVQALNDSYGSDDGADDDDDAASVRS